MPNRKSGFAPTAQMEWGVERWKAGFKAGQNSAKTSAKIALSIAALTLPANIILPDEFYESFDEKLSQLMDQ